MCELLRLPVALVSVSGLHVRLRAALAVLAQRPPDVVVFLDLSLTVASYETFVAARVDQLALARASAFAAAVAAFARCACSHRTNLRLVVRGRDAKVRPVEYLGHREAPRS